MLRATVVLTALVAACSGSPAPTTTAAPGADEAVQVVSEWLGALAEGRPADAAALSHDEATLLLMAAENQLDAGEVDGVIATGLPAALAADYWSSFAVEFARFADSDLDALTVGSAETFVVDGRTFAAVGVSSESAGVATEILVALEDGAWRMDPLATFGMSLPGLMRDLVDRAAATSTLRTALERTARSWLRAGLGRMSADDLGAEARTQIDAIIALLDTVPADS